jgi:hypothetical protein
MQGTFWNLPRQTVCSRGAFPAVLLQATVREEERWARMEAEKAEEEERVRKLRESGSKVPRAPPVLVPLTCMLPTVSTQCWLVT